MDWADTMYVTIWEISGVGGTTSILWGNLDRTRDILNLSIKELTLLSENPYGTLDTDGASPPQ